MINALCGACRKMTAFKNEIDSYCRYCGTSDWQEIVQGKAFAVSETDEIHDSKVAQKLEYLDRLTRLNTERTDVTARITKLCNSIEKDLGIKPAGGIIKTDNVMLLGDKDKETIIPLKQFLDVGEKLGALSDNIVKSLRESMDKLYTKHAVTGMYKREWSEPNSLTDDWHVGKQPDE